MQFCKVMDSPFKSTKRLKEKFGISLRSSSLNPKGTIASKYNSILKKTSKRSHLSIVIPDKLIQKQKQDSRSSSIRKRPKLLLAESNKSESDLDRSNKSESDLNRSTSPIKSTSRENDAESIMSIIKKEDSQRRSNRYAEREKRFQAFNNSLRDNATSKSLSLKSPHGSILEAHDSKHESLTQPSIISSTSGLSTSSSPSKPINLNSLFSKKSNLSLLSESKHSATLNSSINIKTETAESLLAFDENHSQGLNSELSATPSSLNPEYYKVVPDDTSLNTSLSKTTKLAISFLKSFSKEEFSRPNLIKQISIAADDNLICRYLTCLNCCFSFNFFRFFQLFLYTCRILKIVAPSYVKVLKIY